MFVHLPVADMTVSILWLFVLGLAIGTLSGFFGVGGVLAILTGIQLVFMGLLADLIIQRSGKY